MQGLEDVKTAPQGLPQGHPPVAFGKVGVLIVNLGTPDATDYWSMRRYLKEFLSDRRVIETPRALWWPLLNLVILTTRPGRKGRDYAAIWNNERDEGPLRTITRAQSDKLAAWIAGGGLGATQRPVVSDWAMRYGNPSIASRIEALQAQGCERILIMPLYPQYAAATSATVADKAFDALKAMRWQPAVRIAPPWHDDPAYIGALHTDLSRQIEALDFMPELLMLSYHGMPARTLQLGDPYHCHCRKTSRLLSERFATSHPELRIETTFQSRFGKAKWLEPATDTVLVAEAQKGTRRIAIAAPGFSADCLETLEELAIRGRDDFIAAGGTYFAALGCLNAGDEGMAMLEALVRRELSGWI